MMRWLSTQCGALCGMLLGLSALALVPAHASAQSATVSVSVSGFKGVEGIALIALYDDAQSWLKVPKAVQVVRAKITGEAMTVDFKEVKPGTYAVSVIHDENKNNELDMRWLPYPKPKEGLGVSNDPEPKAGPPKWESAKFGVTGGVVKVKATVRYPA